MCCDPVKTHLPPQAMTGPSGPFAREHWTVIEVIEDQGHWPIYHLRCDRFDSHARRCTAYADRPPICSGYPWYGREPSIERAEVLDLMCAFQADVGRTALPIVRIVR